MTTVTSSGTNAGQEVPQGDASSLPSPTSALRFEDLGLSPAVLRAVAESGYTTPTPIQAQGIPQVLKRRDMLGIAQTGTGKTASFTLPMIEMLSQGRAKARMPRSLILEPTRELAAQVAESFERYGKYNKLSMALLIGGTSFDDQEKKLDRGVDVLIATPGRMLDHFERGKLMLSQVQILVVDEADRMLDMGFIPDVERICKLIPFTRQTLFYSATMPAEIQRLTDQFLHNAVRVEVSRPATTATNIKQEIVQVPANDWAKRESLRRLIREADVKNGIVFCNRKRDVDVVAKSLQKHGFSAAALHGDLDQSVRTRTLDSFRSGELRFLVASDVAARGLDIPAVSHIFNFDVPFHPDDYVHRIGRTGRAGRDGHALMLATPKDNRLVEAIESLTGHPIPKRVMEDLEIREETRNSRDRSSGDRRPRREHRGSHEGASRREPDAKREQAATHPAPRTAAARPEPKQAERKQTPRHQQAPKTQPASKQPQAAKQAQHADRESDDLNRLPAFVLRPVILPPKPDKPAPRTRRKVSAEA